MAHEHLKAKAESAGRSAWGANWHIDGWSVAPGRIELIGNHTDYNGGPVLAGAIDRVMVMAAGAISDPTAIEIVAADISPEATSCHPLQLGDWHTGPDDHGPIVYIKGLIATLLSRGIPVRMGVGLAVAGDIPPGFGMSSSAAFCLAGILALTVDEIEPYEMVAIAREAEHRAGAKVGAMDQSASLAGDVIRFDGRDNSFSHIEPNLGEYVFAVADSGVQRSLRTSAYGKRVEETEEARIRLNNGYGLDLPNLADLEPYWEDVFPTLNQHLSDTLIRRVRHIVTETRRVQAAEDAVRANDWETFGRLMDESGASSANDYEISDPVVEDLVAHCRAQTGVLGARMMGGGNGGPALLLLEKDAVDSVRYSLDQFYAKHPIQNPDQAFHVCGFGPGSHRESV